MLKQNKTQWLDLQSYSSRQKQTMPLSGIVGRASFVGPMANLYTLLVWGELLRVGKAIVKGAGWYRIEQ